jgi:hypothetical protein
VSDRIPVNTHYGCQILQDEILTHQQITGTSTLMQRKSTPREGIWVGVSPGVKKATSGKEEHKHGGLAESLEAQISVV